MKKELTDCEISATFKEFTCPIETVFQLIGGKWRARILWELGKQGKPTRFGEIQKALAEISEKTLSHQLHELESLKLVVRQEFNEFPPKVEYSLSDFAETLKPIVNAMAAWIIENRNDVREIVKMNTKLQKN